MEEFYQQTKGELLQQFRVMGHGLLGGEAGKRLAEYGEDVLEEGKCKNTLRIFSGQFCDLLAVILIIATPVSIVSGNVESTIVIITVIVSNAILGTVQHARAEKSLGSPKSLSSPNTKVLRDEQKAEILSAQVVLGDILYLEIDDLAVMDGKALENYSLQVDESSLTGGSINVDKSDGLIHDDCALADRVNVVYSSGFVTYGRAVVFVASTGMGAEIGKIAALMNAVKEKKISLRISLDQFGSHPAMGITVICGLILLPSLYCDMPVLDSLMFVMALVVATIPKALDSTITIAQAMGTQKMTKGHAIIKELRAVESLGYISVICSDKTGALIQNEMVVQNVYISQEIIPIDQLNLRNQLHRYLFYGAILINDSFTMDGKGVGDPAEPALVEMGRKATVDENSLRELMPCLGEIPFDSDRKLMNTKYELHDIPAVLIKGASDVLLDWTVKIRMESGIRDITQEDKDATLQKDLEFSQEGLRVLAFGYKEAPENYILSLDNENDFIFLDLIPMVDPPREESRTAIADAKRAGIRPMMITGDHKITVTAVAKRVGMFEDGDIAMTGCELDVMTKEELDRSITSISVYARVSPENRIRVVDAWQRRGSITTMTGDGVGDAPAPKKVDIGVVMDIMGTGVSKDTAAMILTDDNLATIIKAMANGRNVYRSIKSVIKFLLSGSMAGILSVLYTSLVALPVSSTLARLLFINLLTDSLPAIAIGMGPAEKGLLAEAPRSPKAGISTRGFMFVILAQGGIIAVCTMVAFHMGFSGGDTGIASTMAFSILALARLLHGFNCRSKHNIFRLGFSSNQYDLEAFAAGVCLLGLVMFVPFLQKLSPVIPLSSAQMGEVCLPAVIPTMIIQVSKILRDFSHRN